MVASASTYVMLASILVILLEAAGGSAGSQTASPQGNLGLDLSKLNQRVTGNGVYDMFPDGMRKESSSPLSDCSDREGTEWLPAFDAYGEFINAVVEYYRFTGDKGFLSEIWPAVSKTLAYMEGLRSKRLTKEYQSGDKRACYGLLPESMSHEGYMAHPVHAYWDDFWAIRGLRDASLMAEVLGDTKEAGRLASLQDEMSENVTASLRATMARHQSDFIPGSVEFGDFDPTATSIAIGLLDQLHLLPLKETQNKLLF